MLSAWQVRLLAPSGRMICSTLFLAIHCLHISGLRICWVPIPSEGSGFCALLHTLRARSGTVLTPGIAKRYFSRLLFSHPWVLRAMVRCAGQLYEPSLFTICASWELFALGITGVLSTFFWWYFLNSLTLNADLDLTLTSAVLRTSVGNCL